MFPELPELHFKRFTGTNLAQSQPHKSKSPARNGADAEAKMDNKNSVPKRRVGRKPQPKVDFLDNELRAATEAALMAKTAEVRIVTDVVRSINAARQFYGYPPEWLAKIDRYEIAQALRILVDENKSEAELFKMLTGLKGGGK